MTTITEDGAVFDGSDEADSIAVLANDVRVNAGQGDDWISAILDVAAGPGDDTDGDGYPDSADPAEIATEIHGEGGDDRIHASLRAVNFDLLSTDITAKIYGGDGDDEIWLDMDGTGGSFSPVVDGGAGADTIRVTMFGDGDFGAGGPITVDAGGDNDTVYVSSYSSSGLDVFDVSVTVRAGGGNDLVEAYSASVGPASGGGETHLFGGTGNDTLTGSTGGGADFGSGSNEAEGGDGNDRITLDAGSGGGVNAWNHNTASGDAGNDWIKATAYAFYREATNSLTGGGGDDTVSARIDTEGGGDVRNEIDGGDGNDRLSATITSAPDRIEGDFDASGANIIDGGDGDDRLSGVVRIADGERGEIDLHSELLGGAGNDRLSVRGGDGNILNGGTGNDTLLGSAGADTLIGLGGDDYLRGRGGDDVFLFGAIRNGEQDRIVDFVIGEDKIDLSQIDANTSRGGNQDFTFGTREGTGRVWIEEASRGSSSVLHADNGARELVVVIQDGRDIGPGDYHASDFLL